MISPMIVVLFNTLTFTFPKHVFDQINIGFGLMDVLFNLRAKCHGFL